MLQIFVRLEIVGLGRLNDTIRVNHENQFVTHTDYVSKIFSGNKKGPLNTVSGLRKNHIQLENPQKWAKKEDPTSFETHRVLIDISC